MVLVLDCRDHPSAKRGITEVKTRVEAFQKALSTEGTVAQSPANSLQILTIRVTFVYLSDISKKSQVKCKYFTWN